MFVVLYSILCVLLPCAVYQALALRKTKGKEKWGSHLVLVYLFLFYIYLTLSVAGIGSVWDIGKYDSVKINLIPFQSEGIMTYLLNILMFMPLGFLLPLIWEEWRTLWKTVLTGFCFSMAIEVCQLVNFRITDIDDLMMNTVGTLFGYGIWRFARIVFPKMNQKADAISKREPVLYLLLAVAGEFLFYNWRWFV